MKRLVILMWVVLGPLVGAGQTLRSTIDAGILSQGNKGITATKLRDVMVTVADSVSGKVNKSGGVMSGAITAPSFVRTGGTSSQFLKANGSVDGNTYFNLSASNDAIGINSFSGASSFSGVRKLTNPQSSYGIGKVLTSLADGSEVWTKIPRTNSLAYSNGVFTWEENDGADSTSWAANLNSRFLQTTTAASTYGSLSGNNNFTGSNIFGAVTVQSLSSTAGGNLATAGGNIGVGLTSPQKKLDVADVVRSTTNFGGFEAVAAAGTSYRWTLNNDNQFYLQSSTDKFVANVSTRMTVDNLGNVGIGTTSPQKKLTVAAANNDYAAYIYSNLTAGNNFGILLDAGSNSSDYALRVRSASTSEYFAIKGNGNIGIGTTSPAGAVDITSTTGALIVPRMTQAQRTALTATSGSIVYQTDGTAGFYFAVGGSWVLK